MSNLVIRAAWAISALGGLAAIAVILLHVVRADTAEMQAQCSAVAIAFAVAPYCLARAAEEILRRR